MYNKFHSVKEHVIRNRAKYAAGATFMVMLRLQFHTASEFNAFLKEHDLFDKYYEMDEI
jgi:hypothetical protein